LLPLEGYRVVDFSHLIAGPAASMTLAQQGADVIKIEPLSGERSRTLSHAAPFRAWNLRKRSLTLDLKQPAGVDIARRLISEADVVLESFRPGSMDRLGLGASDARGLNAGVVYVSISGFGPYEVDGSRPGVDAIVQAECGLMSLNGPAGGPPTKAGFQAVDCATALVAAQSILGALLRRERDPEHRGDYLSVSLMDVGMFLQSHTFVEYFITDRVPKRQGNGVSYGYPTDLFLTSDQVWLSVAAYFPNQWITLCEALGRPELAVDERFDTGAGRLTNTEALRKILRAEFAREDATYWLGSLGDVGLTVGAVSDYGAIRERFENAPVSPFLDVSEDDGTSYRTVRMPFRSASWEPRPPIASPALGRDSAAILRQLGYTPAGIAELVAAGVTTAEP
jgi:crotonobetainyl-CoA:carnitine CoA-transferase CaiB-like acyl-CoA transferase